MTKCIFAIILHFNLYFIDRLLMSMELYTLGLVSVKNRRYPPTKIGLTVEILYFDSCWIKGTVFGQYYLQF